ncbi:NAD(P)/FAD-dependent oxidoreductase [Haloprofundus halobius]|uniref:NAD(P)/FAD-dependent oxidoreductase n=1 Tax=Haloprofundus halobius TaxID=2876194 RepID=UPI001CCCE6A3|nr:NAD(P)/FAD-dependent oxidoreductase [Haloprofundus halobius]
MSETSAGDEQDASSRTTESYDVVVVGGGPAGLSTALYTTRLGHDTAVVDRGGGRAAMMVDTHNVIGVTEDVSGNEFLETAREQVKEYGAEFHRDLITEAEQNDDGRFRLLGNEDEFLARRVVLATGFSDERPDPPLPRTGKGLHYCLHCDAYMFVDRPVYVMGNGESAAHVAMIMLNFTDEVDLLLRGDDPEWSDETDERLLGHPVDIVDAEITGMQKGDDGWLEGFEFDDGEFREYRGGFPMYGSNYNTDLAEQLGCELTDDGTVAVDDHGRTSVEGVVAVGDVTPGHNQVPVAMGEGANAGIGIHYDLREFPRSLDEIREHGPVDLDETPGLGARVRDAARAFGEARAPPADDD